jgi:hypothetical protein
MDKKRASLAADVKQPAKRIRTKAKPKTLQALAETCQISTPTVESSAQTPQVLPETVPNAAPTPQSSTPTPVKPPKPAPRKRKPQQDLQQQDLQQQDLQQTESAAALQPAAKKSRKQVVSKSGSARAKKPGKAAADIAENAAETAEHAAETGPKGPQFAERVPVPPAAFFLETLPLLTTPTNLPYALQQILAQATEARNAEWKKEAQILLQAHERLCAAQQVLIQPTDMIGTYRAWLDLQRKLALTQRAIHMLWSGQAASTMQRQMDVLAARYIAADEATRYQRQLDLSAAKQSDLRFLPKGPPNNGNAAGNSAVNAGNAANAAATGTTMAKIVNNAAAANISAATAAASELVSAFVAEAAVAFGITARPVVLTAFDTCPTCHVALRYNQTVQQLVCPVPGCNHWTRFADMTSNALAYGEEVEFVKHAYNPVTHLDKIMSAAEATESYVVPAEALVKVMQRLYATGVRSVADISIARTRQACKDVNVRMDNAVQIYCRIVGRTPRRMTPFMRDQLRIMLCATEGPYRRHAAGRTNHLSFPFSARKDCELLGYWEMVPSFPMLRGPNNVAVHDVITSKVFHDLGWSFTHTLHNHPGLANGYNF